MAKEKLEDIVEEEETDSVETEEAVDVEIEIEDEDEQEDQVSTDTEPDDDKPDENKMVPRTALIAERKKFQQKVKDLEDLITKRNEPEPKPTETDNDDLIAALTATGKIDKDTAAVLAKTLEAKTGKIDGMETVVKKKFRDLEMSELKNDPDYTDIDDVRDDVEGLMDKAGLTAKQAYNALYSDKALSRRLERLEAEAGKKAKRADGYRALDTKDNGDRPDDDAMSTTGGLSRDEQQLARWAGMTAAEYARFKKGVSLEAPNKKKG